MGVPNSGSISIAAIRNQYGMGLENISLAAAATKVDLRGIGGQIEPSGISLTEFYNTAPMSMSITPDEANVSFISTELDVANNPLHYFSVGNLTIADREGAPYTFKQLTIPGDQSEFFKVHGGRVVARRLVPHSSEYTDAVNAGKTPFEITVEATDHGGLKYIQPIRLHHTGSEHCKSFKVHNLDSGSPGDWFTLSYHNCATDATGYVTVVGGRTSDCLHGNPWSVKIGSGTKFYSISDIQILDCSDNVVGTVETIEFDPIEEVGDTPTTSTTTTTTTITGTSTTTTTTTVPNGFDCSPFTVIAEVVAPETGSGDLCSKTLTYITDTIEGVNYPGYYYIDSDTTGYNIAVTGSEENLVEFSTDQTNWETVVPNSTSGVAIWNTQESFSTTFNYYSRIRTCTESISGSLTVPATTSTTTTTTTTATPEDTCLPIVATATKMESKFTYDTDYLVITYNFVDGRDLDIRARIVYPDVGQNTVSSQLGYSYNQAWPTSATIPSDGVLSNGDRPYLVWGTDNQGTGLEAILVDLVRFREIYGSATSITIDCRAFWFSTPGIEPVNLILSAYKGGYMVREREGGRYQNDVGSNSSISSTNLYGFRSTDETVQPYLVSSEKVIVPPEYNTRKGSGFRIGTITYNLTTYEGVINVNDTGTPSL
jgi:hypothetical protein